MHSIEAISSNSEDPLAARSFSREAVVELAKQELNFFAPLALPDTCELPFPQMHTAIWQIIQQAANEPRGFNRLAFGIPRGFVKTTLMKLAIAHMILYTDRQFILMIANTASLAESILADVADILDDSNIVTTYGNWRIGMEQDTQTVKKFNFRGRNIVLKALGSSSAVRGINIKELRPDVILMDDMQSWDNAESQVLSDALLTWMTGTLMKAANKRRCLYVFVGNLYPFDGSILRKLKDNKLWTSLIVGGLLEDGESIWPELQSTQQLLDEFEHDIAMGKPEIFLAEVLNDIDAISRSGIDISAIPVVDEELLKEQHQGSFLIIDPSGAKRTSDLTEIGVFYLYDGLPYLVHVSSGIMDPGTTIKEALRLAIQHKASLVVSESVAYQASLLYWFQIVAAQLGIVGIEFVPIYPRGLSKNARIKTMLSLLVAGKLFVSKAVRSRLLHQIAKFNPAKTTNQDDLLDILAYVYQVLDEYAHFIALSDVVDSTEYSEAAVLTLEDNSLF
jgi:hypothetical protein